MIYTNLGKSVLSVGDIHTFWIPACAGMKINWECMLRFFY